LFSDRTGFRTIAASMYYADVHPPGYFLILHAWSGVFGSSLISLRYFSVLCFVITLIIISRLARLIFPTPGNLSLFIPSFSFILLHNSAIARAYSFTTLLLVVLAYQSVMFCNLSARKPNLQFLTICSFCFLFGIAVCSHYFALPHALVCLAFITWCMWKKSPATCLLVTGVSGLMSSPLLLYFLQHYDKLKGQYFGFDSIFSHSIGVFKTLSLQIFGKGLVSVLPIFSLLLLFVLGAILYYGLDLLRSREQIAQRAFALCFGLTSAASMVLLGLIFDKNLLQVRFFSFSTPIFGVIAGYGFNKIPWSSSLLKRIIEGLFCILLLCAAFMTVMGAIEADQKRQEIISEKAIIIAPEQRGRGILSMIAYSGHPQSLVVGAIGAFEPGGLHDQLDQFARVIVFGRGLEDTTLYKRVEASLQAKGEWSRREGGAIQEFVKEN